MTTEKQFANVTWTHDTYSDGSFRAYAWSTGGEVGKLIADADGATKAEAYAKLHSQLCGWSKTGFGCTLVSSNGDKLTKDGAIDLAGNLIA